MALAYVLLLAIVALGVPLALSLSARVNDEVRSQAQREADLVAATAADLLARLARDAGRVVSRETLMSDVWDENWFGSTKTLDVHVSGLRRKLGDDPGTTGLIQTVRGVGFRLAGEAEA